MDEPLNLCTRVTDADLLCTEEPEEEEEDVTIVIPPPSAVVAPVARYPRVDRAVVPLTVSLEKNVEAERLLEEREQRQQREHQQLRGQRRGHRRRQQQQQQLKRAGKAPDTTPTSLLRKHNSNSPRLRDLLRKSAVPLTEPSVPTRRRRCAQPPARYGDYHVSQDEDDDDDDSVPEPPPPPPSSSPRKTGRTGKKLAVDQMHFRRIKRQTIGFDTAVPVHCRPSFRLPTEQYDRVTDFRYSMGGTWVNGNHCVLDDRDMLPALLTAHTALRPGYKRYMYSDWDATEQDHTRHYGHLAPDDPFVRSCPAYDRSRGSCTEHEVLLVYERSRDKVRFSQFPNRAIACFAEALFAAEVPEHTPRFMMATADAGEPFVLWQNETHRVKCRALSPGACVFCVTDHERRPWLNAWYFDQMLWVKGTAEGSMAVLLGVGWVELVKNLGRLYVLLQDRTSAYQSVALELPLFLTRFCDQQSQLVSDVCLDPHHTVRFDHGLYERYLGLVSRLFPFLRPHLAAERDYFAARLVRLLAPTTTT